MMESEYFPANSSLTFEIVEPEKCSPPDGLNQPENLAGIFGTLGPTSHEPEHCVNLSANITEHVQM